MKQQIIQDFFNTALILWLIFILLEISRPGSVQRFINLEYYFYFLLLVLLYRRLLRS